MKPDTWWSEVSDEYFDLAELCTAAADSVGEGRTTCDGHISQIMSAIQTLECINLIDQPWKVSILRSDILATEFESLARYHYKHRPASLRTSRNGPLMSPESVVQLLIHSIFGTIASYSAENAIRVAGAEQFKILVPSPLEESEAPFADERWSRIMCGEDD